MNLSAKFCLVNKTKALEEWDVSGSHISASIFGKKGDTQQCKIELKEIEIRKMKAGRKAATYIEQACCTVTEFSCTLRMFSFVIFYIYSLSDDGCGPPPRPENGYVNFNSTFAGAVAQYECPDHLKVSGNTFSECTSDGSWSNKPTKCIGRYAI